MSWNIAVAVVLSLALGGWMIFDGVRALMTGDYTTPSSGRYVGQLGPWAGLVQRVGIDPRSTAMKVIFILSASLGWPWPRAWCSRRPAFPS